MCNEFYCEVCSAIIKNDDSYCPECGAIFINSTFCSIHKDNEAEAVCVICSKAYCKECGSYVNKIFLCSGHNHYEIIEGHGRIRGSSDITTLKILMEYLKQNNLHPVIYSQKENTIPLGGIETSDFILSGSAEKVNMYEYKLMLPFFEVLIGERILTELKNSFVDKNLH
jgi:hypothetical protein